SSASSMGRQKTRVQIRIITNKVSSEVIIEAATSTQAMAEPFTTPPDTSPTLPINPENGGIPPMLSAGIKKSTATSGEILASDPSRSIFAEPVRYSINPVTKNNAVWMVMWWTT